MKPSRPTPLRRLLILAASGVALASVPMLRRTSALPVAPPAPPNNNAIGAAELAESHAQLAERFVTAAQDILHNGIPGEHQFRQAATLLDAACALNPSEPRYPRLLAEAWRQLGDSRQVISALTTYRATLRRAAMPEDQVAQVELIDLYLSQMQTDTERLAYLRDLLGKTTFAPEVQSHAAVRCVPLLMQRSQNEAIGMVQQAIRLDPVNLQARRLQYDLIARNGTPLDRIQVLLAMLKCNPAQGAVMVELARQLGDAGLADASVQWYVAYLTLNQRAGTTVDNEILLDFASQMYRAGQLADADTWVGNVLAVNPIDPDAWFMRLAFHRTAAQPVAYGEELVIARRVFVGRAATVARKIMGPQVIPGGGGSGLAPALPPPGGRAPGGAGAAPAVGDDNVSADALKEILDRLKAGKTTEDLRGRFISAVSDLAWFHLYFENAPEEAAPWVAALKSLLPADDVTLARLQGWSDLTSNRLGQAQVELTSVQDIDPLAALGVIRMTARGLLQAPAPQPKPPGANPAGTATRAAPPATRAAAPPATAPAIGPAPDPAEQEKNFKQADAIGQRLLTRYPTGLIGAMLAASLHDRKLAPDPRPDAPAIQAELAKNFPANWVHVIDHPDRFYIVSAQPVKLLHHVGEPLLTAVTIQNTSDYPITIGPEGVISPDLWFDAHIGMEEDPANLYPMAAYERIANVLVLPKKSQVTQIFRFDQGPLVAALRKKPAGSFSLYATVMTNPIARDGKFVPGPAGLIRDFKKQFVRGSSSMADDKKKADVLKGLTGLPAAKMRSLDAMAAYVMAAREVGPDGKPAADGWTLALAPELTDEIDKMRKDVVPDVAAWAAYLACQLADPAERPKLIAPLASSRDWEVRLLGGVAANDLPPADRKPLASQLAHDAEEQLAAFGAAMEQEITQPTSRPAATRPSTLTPPAQGPLLTPGDARTPPAAQGGPGNPTTAPVPTTRPGS